MREKVKMFCKKRTDARVREGEKMNLGKIQKQAKTRVTENNKNFDEIRGKV